MNAQPLAIGAFGDEVADLHRKLRDNGFDVPASELERKFFGPGTRAAVGELQKTKGIKESCEVCEKTEALLNSQPSATTTPAVRATIVVPGSPVITGGGLGGGPVLPGGGPVIFGGGTVPTLPGGIGGGAGIPVGGGIGTGGG